MARIVEFYRTQAGKCPVQDFLGTLEDKEAQKVLWIFRLIERLDRVPITYLKKLVGTEDVWECRISTQRGIYRVFGFFVRGDKLILTHGYSKKTRRTDPREIRRAERYRQDYLDRHKE
jgi:phage-related protein